MESGEPKSAGNRRRLDSWKAIADFLGRDVRSAQRWERERALPVHRVPGEGRGVVFAFNDELEAWLKGGRQSEAPGNGVGAEDEDDLSPRKPLASLGVPKIASSGAAPSPRAPSRIVNGRRATLAACGLALLVGGVYVGIHWHPLRSRPLTLLSTSKRRMLAVLPFLNLSGDPSQEYFADGLTEEMITDVGRMNPQELGVIARTSAMKYKDTHEDVGQIGHELGVAYILEGSVRRAGDEARISAQLIRVSDQTHIWAQDYEVQVKNILSVQEDVAESIANQIRVSLNPRAGVRLTPVEPANPAAYDDYLKGLYFWSRRTSQGLQQGANYFQRAIAEDPNFGPAQAGLADCYINLTANGQGTMMPQARAAALKALAIDDDSADAHAALGAIEVFQYWDWAGAEREFKRAIALDPNDAHAHHWYADLYLDPVGRLPEAIDEMQTAQELDPMSLVINTDLGWAYEVAGYDDRALAQYRKVREMDPAFPGNLRLDYYDLRKGMYGSWVQDLSAILRLAGSAKSAEQMNQMYAAEGYRPLIEAYAAAEGPFKTWAVARAWSWEAAFAYAALGDKVRTESALESGVENRDSSMIYLKVDPMFASLRSDPRFQDLERKMGLLTQ